MMSSVWKPLPDKENPAFIPLSKVRASGPVKSSNRGAITKKQVFGDLKNTIQNFKADGDECGVSKDVKAGGPVLNCDWKMKDSHWPEPESVPANLTVEDDFEASLLPDLLLSELELEKVPNIFKQINKPRAKHVEPDSPIALYQGRICLDIRLEMTDEEFHEIQPIDDYYDL